MPSDSAVILYQKTLSYYFHRLTAYANTKIIIAFFQYVTWSLAMIEAYTTKLSRQIFTLMVVHLNIYNLSKNKAFGFFVVTLYNNLRAI